MNRHSAIIALTGVYLMAATQSLYAGWIRTYGTPAYEEGRSVAQTSDGGFVIGGKTAEALWLIRTNASGDTLWTRTVDNASVNCLRVTPDGGFIVAGTLNSEWIGQSLYILKTDAQGNAVWSKSFGRDYASAQSITQLTNGYLLSGSSTTSKLWVMKTDPSGDTLWTREFGYRGTGLWVAEAEDGGYIIVGSIQLAESLKDDLCILKLNPDGDSLWLKTYGSSDDYERGCDAVKTSDGGLIITGKKGASLWLLEASSAGDTLWSKDWPNACGYGVENAGDGGFVITGMTYSGLAKYDLLLLKTNAQGSQLWKRSYGGNNDEWGYSIKKCSEGGFIIAGLTRSFGAGDYDMWLIRTTASGDTSGVHEVFVGSRNWYVHSPVGKRIVLRYENCPDGFHARIFDESGRKVDGIASSQTNGVITWGEAHNPGVYFIVPDDIKALPERVVLIR